MSWIVRQASTEDADAVDRLLQRSYPRLLAKHYEDSLLQQALPLMTRARPELLVADYWFVAETDEGRIVGCGGWTAHDPEDNTEQPRIGHVRHFATDPDFTRQGIGSSLIHEVFETARNEGIEELHCLSTIAAREFYGSHGFESIADAYVSIGELEFPAIRMKRRLSEES
jgi:N-acetylglutamate synthase-like GNAT family acetyltransferase